MATTMHTHKATGHLAPGHFEDCPNCGPNKDSANVELIESPNPEGAEMLISNIQRNKTVNCEVYHNGVQYHFERTKSADSDDGVADVISVSFAEGQRQGEPADREVAQMMARYIFP